MITDEQESQMQEYDQWSNIVTYYMNHGTTVQEAIARADGEMGYCY